MPEPIIEPITSMVALVSPRPFTSSWSSVECGCPQSLAGSPGLGWSWCQCSRASVDLRALTGHTLPHLCRIEARDFTPICEKIPLPMCGDRLQVGDDRDRIGSGIDHRAAVGARDAADRHQRLASQRAGAAHALRGQPPGRDSPCWRWRTLAQWPGNPPRSDRPREPARDCASRVPARVPPDAHDPAHRSAGEIVLPDMHAVETRSQRQIGAIVHDELDGRANMRFDAARASCASISGELHRSCCDTAAGSVAAACIASRKSSRCIRGSGADAKQERREWHRVRGSRNAFERSLRLHALTLFCDFRVAEQALHERRVDLAGAEIGVGKNLAVQWNRGVDAFAR